MRDLNRWSARVASALTLTICAASAHAQNEGGQFKPVIDSTVRVLASMPDGSAKFGTGWVIAAADKRNNAGAAVIVTARHVVKGAVKIRIVEPGSSIDDQRIGTMVGSTAERDLAFIEVKDITQPALTLTRVMPNVGESVRTIGYAVASDENEVNGRASYGSLKMGGLSKLFRGPISDEAQAPIDQIEFDAPILRGFSGGPLVNHCGRVIGMTVKDGGHIRIGDGQQIPMAQGVAVAVSADEIVKAARDNRIDVKVIDSECGQDLPPPPTPQCSKPNITSEQGRVCLPIPEPPFMEGLMQKVGGPTGAILAIAAAALLVVLATVLAVMRGRRAGPAPTRVEPSSLGATPPSMKGTSLRDRSPTIRLTGRGPSNEPIDLKFEANELIGSGAMLGVEGDNNAMIPDNRANKYVSRQHARLSFDGRNFTIQDNKSTNKTKVGGQILTPSTPRVLVSGDRLELADVVLNVLID